MSSLGQHGRPIVKQVATFTHCCKQTRKSKIGDMTISTLLSMALGLAAFASGQATQPVSSIPSGAPVVDLGYTSYLGYTNDTSGITYYRGIHYAQPPVGALRWQKPRPIGQANDFEGATLNATQVAPSCYQSAPGSLLLGAIGSMITVRFSPHPSHRLRALH